MNNKEYVNIDTNKYMDNFHNRALWWVIMALCDSE